MITITPQAAEQIKRAAQQAQASELPLRIAARKEADDSIQYGMGFADALDDDDIKIKSEGIDVVVAPTCAPLLNGATLDYVELEPGQHNFIFINPNDPQHQSSKQNA